MCIRDSHLSLLSRRKGPVKDRSEGCQDQVRFFATKCPEVPLSVCMALLRAGPFRRLGKTVNDLLVDGGELSFFVLNEAVRGLGIGKQLYNAALTYMRQENIQSFYLFTDISCNYGFYEHCGMQRRGEIDMVAKLSGQQAPMKFFLYDVTC